VRVLDAIPLTLAAGTARVLHALRVRGVDGEPDRTERPEAGQVDFALRRVCYASTQVVGKARQYAGQHLWDGPRHYFRETEQTDWVELKKIFGEPPDATPFGSPLWLLGALSGARDDAEIIGEETLRASATTRIRLTVDRARAAELSPFSLEFPPQPLETFPADVSLDEHGRLLRMACRWQVKGPWYMRWYVVTPRWTTTEFWDFGIPVDIPGPPASPVEAAGHAEAGDL
jgi:hypothetical protein